MPFNQKFKTEGVLMNGYCNFKMKWFTGNSSTNDEGKFEYQEPKLLRVSRIQEYGEGDQVISFIDSQNSVKKEQKGK